MRLQCNSAVAIELLGDLCVHDSYFVGRNPYNSAIFAVQLKDVFLPAPACDALISPPA